MTENKPEDLHRQASGRYGNQPDRATRIRLSGVNPLGKGKADGSGLRQRANSRAGIPDPEHPPTRSLEDADLLCLGSVLRQQLLRYDCG